VKIDLVKASNKDCWKFVKVMSNRNVIKTLYINGTPGSKRKLKTSFFTYMNMWNDFFYMIEVDGKFAGICYIVEYFYHKSKPIDYDFDKATLTFALLPKFWKNGVCTIAVNKLLNIYSESDNPKPIFADALIDNIGSIRVLLKNNFIEVYKTDSFKLFKHK
jgi:RimJ/RimL family protein N-acetyltransferase